MPPSHGFESNTWVRLLNGGVCKVKNLQPGQQLASVDGQPQTVNTVTTFPLTHPLYLITPNAQGGAEPFRVGPDHSLSLRFNSGPTAKTPNGYAYITYWAPDANGVPVYQSISFGKGGIAQLTRDDALNAPLLSPPPHSPGNAAIWHATYPTGINYHITVTDFLLLRQDIQVRSYLIHTSVVQYTPNPIKCLRNILGFILGHQPTIAQVEWMAWYLGLWLADGDKSCAEIAQGGPVWPAYQNHQEVFDKLLDYPNVFGAPHNCTQHQKNANAIANAQANNLPIPNPMYDFRFKRVPGPGQPAAGNNQPITGSICDDVLRRYALLNFKAFPNDLLRDSVAVRERVWAGFIDGDGHFQALSRGYLAEGSDRNMQVQFKSLSDSLGMRTGDIRQHDHYVHAPA